MTLDELKRSVAELHALLPANGLVAWTSGNISGRLEGSRSMVIKPSGVAYEDLTASSMCVVTVDDLEVEGGLKPSSDTATHAVHTHSAYATAFAALGREIPCVLTAMADEFGGPIPCGGFARIGGEEIGQEVVRVLRGHRSPAVLLQSHGVFTIGRTPRDAVKAAVMCEDVARTVHHALQLGTPLPLTQDDIDALHERYTNVYGQ
ncbi:MAG: L-ribulose-5-phosphate 4-epimerase [Deinococcales bacterium]